MKELTDYQNPFEVALEGGPKVEVAVSLAARDHAAAFDFDQRCVSVHESAHAVVATALGIPVKAVDITSRAGGHTEVGVGSDTLPATTTDRMILDQIIVHQAALEAECLIFGQGTTGCADDLSAATSLAYERIRAGLDPNAPLVVPEGIPYWAGATEELRRQMILAAQATLMECRDRARALVEQHREAIVTFAGRLYARRRLEGEHLEALLHRLVFDAAGRSDDARVASDDG